MEEHDEHDVARHPLLASDEITVVPEIHEVSEPSTPVRCGSQDNFAGLSPSRSVSELEREHRRTPSHPRVAKSGQGEKSKRHGAVSPDRWQRAAKHVAIKEQRTNSGEKLFDGKPFTAQSVLHSLFKESKLSQRPKFEEPDSVPLSPATNDPLLNPQEPEDPGDTAAIEHAPAAAPTAGTKNKVRWSKYIPWVWTIVMSFILFGFLPWGIYTLHEEATETYVQVISQRERRGFI